MPTMLGEPTSHMEYWFSDVAKLWLVADCQTGDLIGQFTGTQFEAFKSAWSPHLTYCNEYE